LKVQQEKKFPKKKAIVFRATPSITEDNDSMDEDEEDKFDMLIRKVEKNVLQEGKNDQFL